MKANTYWQQCESYEVSLLLFSMGRIWWHTWTCAKLSIGHDGHVKREGGWLFYSPSAVAEIVHFRNNALIPWMLKETTEPNISDMSTNVNSVVDKNTYTQKQVIKKWARKRNWNVSNAILYSSNSVNIWTFPLDSIKHHKKSRFIQYQISLHQTTKTS